MLHDKYTFLLKPSLTERVMNIKKVIKKRNKKRVKNKRGRLRGITLQGGIEDCSKL